MVETYLSGHVEGEPEATFARVEAAARATATGGEPVRYVRSIFVPDDESCLLLVEASVASAAVSSGSLDPRRAVPRAGVASRRDAEVEPRVRLPTACRAASPVPRVRGHC